MVTESRQPCALESYAICFVPPNGSNSISAWFHPASEVLSPNSAARKARSCTKVFVPTRNSWLDVKKTPAINTPMMTSPGLSPWRFQRDFARFQEASRDSRHFRFRMATLNRSESPTCVLLYPPMSTIPSVFPRTTMLTWTTLAGTVVAAPAASW